MACEFFFLLNSELSDIVVKQLPLVIKNKVFSTPFWHLSQSLQSNMETRLGWKKKKKKLAKMAHNKGNKCQQTFYRTPSCKTHHQEGGPGAHWNKSGEQKTVKEILKLRPKLIEEMYAQVCSCTQNLLIKEKFTCLHVELAWNRFFGLYPPKLCFYSRASNAVALWQMQ